MKFKHLPVKQLKKYSHNPNSHSKSQIAQIAASIKEFGFNVPIVIDENMEVKAGHGRLEAAIAMKLDKVPTVQIEGLSEQQWKAFVITDNKLNRNSTWDEEMLKSEIMELMTAGFDLSLTGFSGQELNDILTGEIADVFEKDKDDAPTLAEEDAPLRCEMGEVWKLGKHVMMVGDSTVAADVDKLMDGHTAQLMWIDPPYNVDYESSDGKKIANDHMENEVFLEFLTSIFKNAYRVMDPGAPYYVAHASNFVKYFIGGVEAAGFLVKQTLIWVKSSFTLGRQDYQWQHEPILYGWKPGEAHKWYGHFDKKTIAEIGPGSKPLAKMNKAELLAILEGIENESTIIRVPKPMRSALHPTMKPIDLIQPHIQNSSTIGDTVVDFCGGSGSTLIACEITHRKARIMEYDPRYADAIIRRFEEFTGKTAERICG